MSEEEFEVGLADPRGPEAAELISALSAELARRYDYMEDGSGGFKPEDALGPRGAFVIGRIGGHPVACGAIRPLEEDVAELKRVFVKVDSRGGVTQRPSSMSWSGKPESGGTGSCGWRRGSVSRRRSRYTKA